MLGATIATMNLYGYAGQNPIKFIDPTGLVSNLDLLDPTLNSDQQLLNWAQSYAPPGYNSVIIHGTDNGQFSTSSGLGGQTYTPDQLAQTLENSPGYDPNLPTQLVACQAAGSGGAQAFANSLQSPVLGSPLDLHAPLDANQQVIPNGSPVIELPWNNQWYPVYWNSVLPK